MKTQYLAALSLLLLMGASSTASADDLRPERYLDLVKPLRVVPQGLAFTGGTIEVTESDNRPVDVQSTYRLTSSNGQPTDVFLLIEVSTFAASNVGGDVLTGSGIRYRKLCTTPCTFKMTGSQTIFVEPNSAWSLSREIKADGVDHNLVVQHGSSGARAAATATGLTSFLGILGGITLLPTGYLLRSTALEGDDRSRYDSLVNYGWVSLGVGVATGVITYLIREPGYTTIQPE